MLDESRISFNLELTWHGEVFWDRNQMRQVFMNLIQNSVDAISNTGEIKIKTAQLSGGNIEITFSDTGPGIDVDKISKIFNLYFTTKAQGTGIGLSIVQRIIYEHNGVINLIQSNYGTVFAINLPVRVLSQR
jgi:signal transduction histidine kinase